MISRIGYGLAAMFWLSLFVNMVMNPVPFVPTGNANFDTGVQSGGWLFSGFIIYAALYCSWKAIRGPRVVHGSIQIDAVPQSSEIDNASPARSAPDVSSVIQPSGESDRDSDIIRYVLENERKPPSDRVYFLTLTPRNEWGDTGAWQDLPTPLLEAMPSITGEYRLAHGAYLKEIPRH